MIFWSKPEDGQVEDLLREEARKSFTYEGYVRLTRDVRSAAELEAALQARNGGATFDVDHLRVRLGSGAECYARAKEAMASWKMLQVPSWFQVCWPHSPIREGETLGQMILSLGVYSFAIVRIVYVIDEGPPPSTASDTPSPTIVQSGAAPTESVALVVDDSPPEDGVAQLDTSGGSALENVFRPAVKEVERFGFAYGTLPCHLISGEERFLLEWDKSDDSVWYELLSFSKPNHWMTTLGYPITRLFQDQFRKESAQALLLAIQDDTTPQEEDV